MPLALPFSRDHRRAPVRVARSARALLLFGAVGAIASGCAGTPAADDTTSGAVSSRVGRSFASHPAVVDIDDADEIYALSDPHGGYATLGALLQANHLVTSFSADPREANKAEWTGGTAILVVAGDLIDKGPESLGVIDLLRSLEKQAPMHGGRVVVTLGNHEAEFLDDPKNDKATREGLDATGIDRELDAQGIDPKDVAAAHDDAGRGAWLRDLPFAVRIKKWFFAHGGNTHGDSLHDLEDKLEGGLDKHGWGDDDVTGSGSILEDQSWYGDPDKDDTGRKYADALGVEHIVFGHDPGAFGEHGKILASKDGSLVKLDVDMGLHFSDANTRGQLLHVKTVGKDSAEILDADGAHEPLL